LIRAWFFVPMKPRAPAIARTQLKEILCKLNDTTHDLQAPIPTPNQ
jgi:hypothetical protein